MASRSSAEKTGSAKDGSRGPGGGDLNPGGGDLNPGHFMRPYSGGGDLNPGGGDLNPGHFMRPYSSMIPASPARRPPAVRRRAANHGAVDPVPGDRISGQITYDYTDSMGRSFTLMGTFEAVLCPP